MPGVVHIDVGREGLTLSIPPTVSAIIAQPQRDPPLVHPTESVRQALRSPLGSRPLQQVTRGKKRAAIVVSDITRPVPYRTLLPPLLGELHDAGIEGRQIEIIIATGLHRPNTVAEIEEMLGTEIASRYSVRNHIARDEAQHEYLGRTSRGTPIWIDRGFLAADLRILTGLIEPHLMAGYSGGRKALCPGLAAVETVRHVHGAAMLDSFVGPGILAGNPFHEELLEIVTRVGVDFLCDVTIDRQRRLTGVFAGDVRNAHAAGVRELDRQVHVPLPQAAEVVLTSAGGYPLDRTLYQSIKGLVAALNVLQPGGTIVLFAELSEGIGSPEFIALLAAAGSPEAFRERLRDANFFQIDQWMVQHLCQVLARGRVVIVTPAPRPALSEGFDIEWLASWEQACALLLARHGSRARWVILPEGPYTLATVEGVRLPLTLQAG